MSQDFDTEPVPDYLARTRLTGQVCAVVGGGRGIGRQTLHALRQAGAQVICIDTDLDRAQAVAAEVEGHAYKLDATRAEEVEAVFREIADRHGRLDAVVDIVGASMGAPVLSIEDELIRRNFELNLFQAMHVTRFAGAAMAKHGGGAIVLIGSIAGISNLPNQALYGSAKAALHHFVRYAATELGHLGVRVNAVAPGYVRTERMVDRFSPEIWEEIAQNTPLQRAGQTPDIAGAALFLTSGLSDFVTGQVLVADGGLLNAPRIMKGSSARQITGKPIGD